MRQSAASAPGDAMSDSIRLTGLRAYGHHGVFDHERRDGQEFLVDLEVRADLRTAGRTDALADTVDYGALAAEAVAVITGPAHDLIETVAEEIAERCLAHCASVSVTVHKPQAPIAHEFADASVTIHRSRRPVTGGVGEQRERPAQGPATALLALGANVGEPLQTLRDAAAALDLHPRIRRTAASRIYRTAPVGGVEQPDFLNAAVIVETSLPPLELLAVCQGIEVACGRVRTVRWGPRTLDIDLIRYTALGGDPDEPRDEVRSDTERLRLPHPLAVRRAFVLAPWLDLAPHARVGGEGGSVPVEQALSEAPDAAGLTVTEEPLI
jgi:dihydroneopterin aldolase / 2-amino-4-hydroxy-6-hydroxymethyldihydropteridine diphosphokinase